MTPSDAAWAVQKFELHCWARARLLAEGEIPNLPTAVDDLQRHAESNGVGEVLTQDEIQELIAHVFDEQLGNPMPESPQAETNDMLPPNGVEIGEPWWRDPPSGNANDAGTKTNGRAGEPPPDETPPHGLPPPTLPDADTLPLTLAQWAERDLPQLDCLLGHWLTTTSRVLLVGPTGLGKTNFLISLGLVASAGAKFLHWSGRRPARVLYVDGEMSRRLLKQRLTDATNRFGGSPIGFHALSHEDIDGFAPINTADGQRCINAVIDRIGGLDLVIFDSVMCLVAGEMKDEEAWRQTMPYVRDLTRRNVGQMWAHHTGHDESRSYGTKTREWQLDTVLHMEGVERQGVEVSFSLEFRKARERTPATRADFQTARIALVGDSWQSDLVTTARRGRVSPLALKFLSALQDALAEGGELKEGRRCVSLDLWRAECARIGLFDGDAPANTTRALFSKYRRELIGENHVVCDNDFAWLAH